MDYNDFTVIDIETIPNEDMINRLPKLDIKYGNIKDELKREEKGSREKQKQIDKMALSPMYGRVCCVSTICADETDYIIENVDTDAKEKEVIRFAMDKINVSSDICTWNGMNFDIPFIYKRAIILGVNIDVVLSYYTKKYTCRPHCDLMQLWCNWTGYEGLENVSKVLFGKNKVEFDVTKIKNLIKNGDGRERVVEYCIKDSELTQEILRKTINKLF